MSRFKEYLEQSSDIKLSTAKEMLPWKKFIEAIKTEGLEYALTDYPYKGKDKKMLKMQKEYQELIENIKDYLELQAEKYNLDYNK